jgi:hypothetical protein
MTRVGWFHAVPNASLDPFLPIAEYSASDRSPSPTPPPLPRVLRRRPSITMPGSLFPRSPSLEPDLHREMNDSRRVRFAADVFSPPHRDPYHQSASPLSMAGPSLSPTHSPENPSPDRAYDDSADEGSPPSSPFRPPAVSSVKEAVQLFHSGLDEADPALLLPKETTSPSSKLQSPSRRQRTLQSTDEGSPSFSLTSPRKGKGKERESVEIRDFVLELPSQDEDEEEHEHYGDISSGTMQVRMRGKELELDEALERERQRDEAGATTHADGDERQKDKDRIRMLEEEIRRLRAEVIMSLWSPQ